MKKNEVPLIFMQGLLLLALGITPAWHGPIAAQDGMLDTRPVIQLSPAIWAHAQRAQGVVVGGRAGGPVRVQVVFDANCPYCALLYKFMKSEHPDIAVRWIPVAYLLPDSGPRAGAILVSADPAASLDKNFSTYDFNGRASHGGYVMPSGKHYTLPAANVELQSDWAHRWGGATPTVLFKNRDGSVTRVLGFERGTINRLLQSAGPGLPEYRK